MNLLMAILPAEGFLANEQDEAVWRRKASPKSLNLPLWAYISKRRNFLQDFKQLFSKNGTECFGDGFVTEIYQRIFIQGAALVICYAFSD